MTSRPTTASNHHESVASFSATPSNTVVAGKALPQTMQLPNVPKMTDERSRGKYVAEYDRYEQELRKHHLGPVESTTTVGLKDLSSSFSRRVPLLNEPTAAEKEYEHTQQALNARRKKEHRFYTVTGSSPAKKRGASPPNGDSAVSATARRTAPSSLTGSSAATPVGTGGGAADLLFPANAASSAGPSATQSQSPHCPLPAALVKPTASEPALLSATTAAQNRAKSSPSLTSFRTTAIAPAGDSATPSAAPAATGTEPAKDLPKRTSRQHSDGAGLLLRTTTAATTRPPGTKASVVKVSSPRPMRSPSPATKTATRSDNRRLPGKAARSAPLTPSPPPPPAATRTRAVVAAPVAKLRSAKALEAALEANISVSLGSAAKAPSKLSPATTRSDRQRSEVDDVADLVRVLVMPPEVFSDSVKLDTDQYDLDWVSGFRTRPPQLVTLHNFLSTQSSSAASQSGGGAMQKINSPRSALVCLRNGIDPADLLRRSDASDAGEATSALPTEPALREAVLRFRHDRDAARRQQLMTVLLDDYLTLCAKVPQAELIQAVQNPPQPIAATALPSSLLQRRERQRRIFEMNKQRMEKQLAMEKDQYERRLAAEARQLQAEQEASAALESKARAEAEARAQQQARLDAQKAKNMEMEAFYQRQLEEKLARAEEKNQARLEAQQRLFDTRHEARVRKEEERRARFERNAQRQADLVAEVEAKRMAKAAQLEALAQERDARIAQERQELKEKQARAAEAREAAKQRAAQEEEEVRQSALKRQAEADERLREFHEHRQEELMARSAEEQLKAQRRVQIYEEAQEKERQFQEAALQRQLTHDARFSEVRQQRALELAIRREQEREDMKVKAFAVVKKQRMDEYKKLRTVAELVEKRQAAEFVDSQRDAIQQAMLRERDMLNAERDALRAQFGAVTN